MMVRVDEPRTLTLTDFLTARLEEDEKVAREAEDAGAWEVRPYAASGVEGEVFVVSVNGPNDFYGAVCGAEYEGYHSTVAEGNATHIARHDPRRVLAEVEAKRQIVETIEATRATGTYTTRLLTILMHLALPYADHPDYRPEWRP